MKIQNKTFLAGAAALLTGFILSTSADAATISHSIGIAPEAVDLTTDGTQDWALIDFNISTETFETHNTKNGGSGITLGAGFGEDIGTLTLADGLRGPTYTYADGTSPVTEAASKRNVGQGETLDFDDILNTYTMTFGVISPGVEHTVNVYLTTGRVRWTDISATWANANPTSLSTSDQQINGAYTLVYTPDTFADDVTVTFTGAVTESSPNDYRLGFTAVTLAAVPEPGSLALLTLGGLLIGARRRRG